jgi:hypothetical protein
MATRAVDHAGAVAVELVAGAPEVVMALKLEVVGGGDGRVPGQQLGAVRVERQAVVRVREIGARRKKQRELALLSRSTRPDGERDVLLRATAPQAHRVHTTRQAGRELRPESLRPASVFEVVVVEMDRAVLIGRVAKARLPARPVVAGHASRRHVDALPMELVAGRVEHSVEE